MLVQHLRLSTGAVLGRMENGVGASWALRKGSTCAPAHLVCHGRCWGFSGNTRAGRVQLCKNLLTDVASALPLPNPSSLSLVSSSFQVLSLSMCQTEHISWEFVLFIFKEVHVKL